MLYHCRRSFCGLGFTVEDAVRCTYADTSGTIYTRRPSPFDTYRYCQRIRYHIHIRYKRKGSGRTRMLSMHTFNVKYPLCITLQEGGPEVETVRDRFESIAR